MAKIVFVIAEKNFRDEELFHTKEEIEKAGHSTVIASLKKGECLGMLGGKATAEKRLDEINEKDFDALIFVGGIGSAIYFDNKKAQSLAKEFFNKGKIVAAICIAPSILANAGILKGKKATCFSSEANNLKEKGAIHTAKAVEIDGNIITASGPMAAHDFGKKIASVLK